MATRQTIIGEEEEEGGKQDTVYEERRAVDERRTPWRSDMGRKKLTLGGQPKAGVRKRGMNNARVREKEEDDAERPTHNADRRKSLSFGFHTFAFFFFSVFKLFFFLSGCRSKKKDDGEERLTE